MGADDLSVRIGDFSISPAFAFGSDVSQVGLSANYNVKVGDWNLGVGSSIMNGSGNFSGLKGLETRYSGMVSYNDGNVGFGVGLNRYSSGETSQSDWLARASWGRWSFAMSNDLPWSDKYRTAAAEIGYRLNKNTDLAFGLNLYTGDPSNSEVNYKNPNAWNGTYTNVENDNMRAGVHFFGVRYKGKSYKAGYNSDQIRHFWQNEVVHTQISRSPWFRQDPSFQNRFYYQQSTYNPYSLY